MKQRTLTNSLVACAIALAMVSSLAAQNVTQVKAKVVRIKGYARFSTGNNVWQPLKVGEIIKPGSIIQTGVEKGSFVDLILGNDDGKAGIPEASGVLSSSSSSSSSSAYSEAGAEQNIVRIWENSLLGVDKLTSMDTGAEQVTETQLDLKAGRIFGTVKKMSPMSKYEIKLPTGVAGIRGTIYDISADGVVRVARGSVVVAYVTGDGTVKTQIVSAGQQFDPRSEQLTQLSPTIITLMIQIAKEVRAGLLPPGALRHVNSGPVLSVSPVGEKL